jgi:cytochrome c553
MTALVVPGLATGWPTLLQADDAREDSAPQYTSDILPLLQAHCVRCHGGEAPKGELDLSTPAGLRRGGESGPVVTPGKPDDSALYEKIRDGSMPPDKKNPLAEGEIATIRRWLERGATIDSDREDDHVAQAAVTQHDALPILLRRCTTCHGARRQEGGLDLRSKETMLRGGKSGPAFVAGSPDASLIVKRLRSAEMPPPDRLVEASVKPVEPAECDTIARWIATGASEVAVEPDVASTARDPLVTDQDRDFWAFRAPRRPPVPEVAGTAQLHNPIDAFVVEKLAERGLRLSPEADRATLLRRATFDLTGLPPAPDEVDAFLIDTSGDAYERLIDRLLDSPRYGERWGRIWLDVAGYADSEGKREQDLPRQHAWRYRDYVIRSLAADKPYDRFLVEQLAGDELVDYEHAAEITPEIYDNLVATGFLRMASDATWANITCYVDDRLEVIADEIDVLGSAVLGLTMKCARCHSHKFDPIPQRDYYRLTAVFKGAFDEHDWLKPDVRPGVGPLSQDVLPGRLLPYVTTVERRAWDANNERIGQGVARLKQSLEEKTLTQTAKLLDGRLAQLPEALRADLRTMLVTAPEKRDTVQIYLAEKFESQLRVDRDALRAADAEFKAECEKIEREIKALEAQRTTEPMVHALWDRGEPSPTYVYRRGESASPGRLVGPGVPSVLTDGHTPFDVQPPWPGVHKTGRRLAFARWLVQPDHPLTSRVMVNRIWKHHFGTGIVKSLGNFGRAGTPPTHPELLDWLAREFIDRGWSIKAMHRLMMTSATYRQSSAVTPAHDERDPDNSWLSRMPLVRLDAEQLYDALLAVAGRLDATQFGPGDAVQLRDDGLLTPIGGEGGWRRLVYVKQMRKQLPTHLENFDYPQMNPNCIERRDSTVAPQALHLLNNGMVRQLAEHFAKRVSSESGAEPAREVDRVYLVALGRHATADEVQAGVEALQRLKDVAVQQAPGGASADETLAVFCHAIMNSAAFLYID